MRRKKEKPDIKTQEFAQVVEERRIPPLVLDQRWHKLFRKTGKPEEISSCEEELNVLLQRQGKLNDEIGEYKQLKSKLLHSIVHNMDGTSEDMENSLQSRVLNKNQELIGELNEKLDASMQEQEELPKRIEEKNKELMLKTMVYCEAHERENRTSIALERTWLSEIKKELKQHIGQKRRCEEENREIYQFLEGIFGMDLLHIFQIPYDEYAELFDQNKNMQ
ncbi:MAG: hypothetical protein ACI4HI_11045 [Lachnospiraceae bacterium]